MVRYSSNIEMAGGIIRYVPLSAPQENTLRTSSAEWTIDFKKLNDSFNEGTKMIVSLLSDEITLLMKLMG